MTGVQTCALPIYKVPAPGHNDIFALFKRGKLKIEGDLHPFMANLLYIKDVLAAPRKEAA